MNIFEQHLSEIRKLIFSEKDTLKLEDIDNLKGVNLEVPPEQFNFDLSCNIAMVLGKKNKIDPKTLALKLKEIFLSFGVEYGLLILFFDRVLESIFFLKFDDIVNVFFFSFSLSIIYLNTIFLADIIS